VKAVIKQWLVTVLAGVTVAILVPLVTGCSSPGGCRTCRNESPGREPAPLGYNLPAGPAAPVLPAAPPGGPATAAAPYGGQKTCPVTGEELGSMGEPVPVTLKGKTVYVCCRGCAGKAQAEPDKTLAAVAAERAR
jgi:hypothetical protein